MSGEGILSVEDVFPEIRISLGDLYFCTGQLADQIVEQVALGQMSQEQAVLLTQIVGVVRQAAEAVVD